jgi:transcriptional regulator with XRE-family HTH domain
MIDVGNRIKSIRKRKGLTLQDLSEKSGMSATAISAIERNVSSPTVNTLASIGKALGESLSSLLGEADIAYVVTRADGRERPATLARGADLQSLAAGVPGQRFQPMIGVLAPGATSGDGLVNHRGDDFLFVLKGALDVESNGNTIRLGEGDSVYLRENTPYRWKNAAAGETQIILVSTA